MLAQQAINTVVGDLRTEIAAGSVNGGTPVFTNPNGVVTKVYYPSAPSNAVPVISGFTNETGLENLVKISSANGFVGLSGNGVAVTNRASTISTTERTASADGRYISPARWNKALLIPPTSTNDATPSVSFTPPSWIYVARDGSTPTTPVAWSPTNPSSVIGRFAYAIYDEGGLLDANVAGYPQGNTDVNKAAAYKSALAYADLTQIGLSAANVITLVDWRNKATIAGSPTNFISYVTGNTNGFLTTANTNLASGKSDQFFTSRQQLIDFVNTKLGGSNSTTVPVQNALQYLTHFSRSFEQPSYRPDPNRPRVVSGSASDPADGGGNNAGTTDNDLINPSFLSVRVTNSFIRTNSFTQNVTNAAVVGEPLVKQRFPLNRLAWITYKGPSASVITSDPAIQAMISNGISPALIANGTEQNIKRCFGLTWNSSGGYWTYNQNSSGSGSIYKLPEIAASAAREPDFFELLKAATHVGAIAKASTKNMSAASTGSGFEPLNWQYRRDSSVDYAIMQQGANIIDQFDPDSFPIRIRFDDGGGTGIKEFRGIEDLPYIYRIRLGTLLARNSSPPVNGTHTLSMTNGTNATVTIDRNSTFVHSTANGVTYPESLTDAGVGVLVALPDLWNPHDRTVPQPPTSLQPAELRVTAASATPDEILTDGAYNQITVGVRTSTDKGYYRTNNDPTASSNVATTNSSVILESHATDGNRARTNNVTPAGPNFPGGYQKSTNITTNTSSIQIPHAANLFREPTIIIEKDKPITGVSMTCSDPDLADVVNSSGTKVFRNGSLVLTNSQLSKSSGDSRNYVGIFIGVYPLRWVGPRSSMMPSANSESQVYTAQYVRVRSSPAEGVTYMLQYQNPVTASWTTYDEKYGAIPIGYTTPTGNYLLQAPSTPSMLSFADPRAGRFGAPNTTGGGVFVEYNPPNFGTVPRTSGTCWLDTANNVVVTDRPDTSSGFGTQLRPNAGWSGYAAFGWHFRGIGSDAYYQTALFSQNNPYYLSDGRRYTGDNNGPWKDGKTWPSDANFFSDPDGVVRRAMGAYVPAGSSAVGLPLATANTISGGAATPTAQSASRPLVINRPFHSVAELGYVFSGTPWRNLDLFTPESGYSALLDVFCINPPTTDGLVAGKINLNTRQTNVAAAVIAGGYRDTLDPTNSSTAISPIDATNYSTNLISFTRTNVLANPADLVGRWSSRASISGSFTPALNGSHNIDGAASYKGFSAMLTSTTASNNLIQRFREAPIRALQAAGQTRVWNLMFDLIVQTGKFPSASSSFNVEGEQRYWVHLAIDRMTGQVLDKQIEVVKE